MTVDKAPANFCNPSELRRGGDTGKRRVEHRSCQQLTFTHTVDTGYRVVRVYLFESPLLGFRTN